MRSFALRFQHQTSSRSPEFYTAVLGTEADDTVPSRIYFHCGEVIVAVIDWQAKP